MDNESDTSSAMPESVMTGPGTHLKKAREAAGMSIEELARRLHLKPEILTALENDDFARLPEPAYVRGYLRAVAKTLAIDEAPLMESYAALSPPEPRFKATERLQEPFRETRGRKPVYVIAAVLLLVIVGLFAWRFFVEPPHETIVGETSIETEAPILSGESGADSQYELPVPVDESVDIPEEPPIIEAVPDESPATPAAPAVQPATATPGVDRVQITVRNDSWIEIRDADDRRLFSDLLRAGAERTIEGRSPMRVIIGNTEGVSMTFNDRPVEIAPHVGRDRVARFTLPSP